MLWVPRENTKVGSQGLYLTGNCRGETIQWDYDDFISEFTQKPCCTTNKVESVYTQTQIL